MEGETWEEEQSRPKIELTLVHMCVTVTLNGLQISGLVHLPFQQNIVKINSTGHHGLLASLGAKQVLAVATVRSGKKRKSNALASSQGI